MSSKTLYLIDISAYVFRAYYAIRALKTSQGVPTNATYGVVTMLLKFLREKKPDHLVVVFDSPKPSFRKTIYPLYKANRAVPPEDLPPQFAHIKEFVDLYPLPSLQKDGFEADDIIATLVNNYRKNQQTADTQIVIVSADKDLMQLIGPGVSMYDSMREKIISEKEVSEKFGVGPDRVIDVQALSGDQSDNIPGVKGVGAVTAGKLISEWGCIENLYDNLEKLKGTIAQKLRDSRESAFISKKLVTLTTDVPLETKWQDYEVKNPDQKKLQEFYRKLEFTKLFHEQSTVDGRQSTIKITKTVKQDSQPSATNYDLVLTEKQLSEWVSRLQKAGGFAFDTETTGINAMQCGLVGLSFSESAGSGCYIPVGHSYLGCEVQLPMTRVLAALKPLFENPNIKKWAQNGKFDMEVLFMAGIRVLGLAGDSMIASYLLTPESSHNLDSLAQEYLQYKTIHFADVVPKGQTFAAVELPVATNYAAEDADIALQLVQTLEGQLQADKKLLELYQEIEIPLIDVLFAMETHGVLLDLPFLKKLGREFGGRLLELEKAIFKDAGVEFNVQSPKQLQEILFGKLNLPPQRKTKTGYSTDVDVLTALSPLHPLPKHLLEHRLLAKLQSTYVDQLQALVHPRTGRIHTSYHQAVAATGRLSSSDPNLQNIPIRSEEGRRIREAFCAPAGSKILSADYSQIEIRLLAAFSQDANLVAAFKNDQDVHAMTAAKIFAKNGEKVSSDMRAMAKTVNFGVLYGQSPFGLAGQLGIPQAAAKNTIDEFYAQYPSVMHYKEQVLDLARQAGEVRTWLGRRRLVPEMQSQNRLVRQNAERFAFNTIFQGSAADLIKKAMILINEKLSTQKLRAKMIMQVHDELIFEVPDSEVAVLSKLVKHEMENAIPCEVPLKVDVGVGKNWAEAH